MCTCRSSFDFSRCHPAERRKSSDIFRPTPSPKIYSLSLHDALPICDKLEFAAGKLPQELCRLLHAAQFLRRSEEHTSELQSRFDLVCRLLLEKKKGAIRLNVVSQQICAVPIIDVERFVIGAQGDAVL